MTKSGVTISGSDAAFATAQYRFYKNSVTSFSVSSGAITKIVFTGTSSNPASGFGTQSGWTTNGNNGTWTGNSSSVSFTASGAQVRASKIVVTVEAGAAPDPTISADNVSIAYDAISGSITYTINNEPSPAGTLTAAAETGSWLTIGTVNGSAVPFTCSANSAAADRSTTVTLTYSYGDNETVTKDVTVTQAGNPNIVDNIEDITAAGNYKVKGTIVAKSQRGFIVGDGTGYVYYYNTNYTQGDYAIGDKVKLDGSVVAYGGVYEFNNSTTVTAATESNYVAENPTVLTGQEMDTRVASSAASLSSYVQYEGTLSVSGTYYNITSIDGAQTAKGSISFPLNTSFTSLNGKKVKVTGYYVGVSSSQYYNTMIGSIEEVVVTVPTIYANPASVSGLDYVEGGSCTAKTFSVSGENLTADITATLSGSDFEMSLDGTNFTNSLTLAPASGAVAATNISVRLKDGKAIGEYTGTITLSSTGATTVTVSLSGSVTAPEAPNVTWNLSIDETATATEDEMTWTSNYVTMGVVKGNAGTNTNNYYPGTPDQNYTSTRFYKNSILTIAPVAGCTIIDVVFEATSTGYASALQSSTWTNATATVSNTTVTVTPANGALAISATIGGTCGFTSVKVHYAIDNTPFITVIPDTAEWYASDDEGVHTIVYGNLEISDMDDFAVQFYDENGDELNEDPDWIEALVAEQDPSEGEGYVLSYFMLANEGEAARTAYLKVFAMGVDAYVYSNLVTITQLAPEPPEIDYATLPFEFDGGKNDALSVNGLTWGGLANDYGDSPKLKFDTAGNEPDWMILKINEAPGMLYFDIKGNGAGSTPWEGTFKVQTSTDGVTYTDLVSFTELGATQTMGYGLEYDVRYIKWVYTEKVVGNVALGNIRLEKPTYTVLNLTEGPAGYWGTIYNSTICYILPAGAQAFTMNADKKLYRLGSNGGVIPANTAVVIIADSATIKLDTGDPIGEVTVHGGANILQGSDGTVSANGHQYVLAKKNGVIGFYKFEGTSIPAGKAYYEINE